MNRETPPTGEPDSVEMPKPTAAPLVLAVGVVLLAAGVATSMAFFLPGGVLFLVGLTLWIAELLPGRGHQNEPRVEPALRPQPVKVAARQVEQLQRGMPGYRLRLPLKVHPVSAGIKGGLIGGLVMPLPALAYGLVSGHGIWWPINLMAGMVLPNVGAMSVPELEQFRPVLLVMGVSIHLVVTLILGLLYGVLMPTLPHIPKPLAWGAILMPLFWTAASYLALGSVNPGVREAIEWPWFVVSQLVFGLIVALVFMIFEKRRPIMAGLLGGVAGGVLMPIPALLWSLATGHGVWYPVNLLSALIMRHEGVPSVATLEQFHAEWFFGALVVHAIFSLSFGLALALVVPRIPTIPSPLAWGGMLLPLFWTALSYGMMGVVNPLLQERVDWPWFVASQFVFGIVAAIVVVRSEQVHVPPAGHGTDRVTPVDTN